LVSPMQRHLAGCSSAQSSFQGKVKCRLPVGSAQPPASSAARTVTASESLTPKSVAQHERPIGCQHRVPSPSSLYGSVVTATGVVGAGGKIPRRHLDPTPVVPRATSPVPGQRAMDPLPPQSFASSPFAFACSRTPVSRSPSPRHLETRLADTSPVPGVVDRLPRWTASSPQSCSCAGSWAPLTSRSPSPQLDRLGQRSCRSPAESPTQCSHNVPSEPRMARSPSGLLSASSLSRPAFYDAAQTGFRTGPSRRAPEHRPQSVVAPSRPVPHLSSAQTQPVRKTVSHVPVPHVERTTQNKQVTSALLSRSDSQQRLHKNSLDIACRRTRGIAQAHGQKSQNSSLVSCAAKTSLEKQRGNSHNHFCNEVFHCDPGADAVAASTSPIARSVSPGFCSGSLLAPTKISTGSARPSRCTTPLARSSGQSQPKKPTVLAAPFRRAFLRTPATNSVSCPSRRERRSNAKYEDSPVSCRSEVYYADVSHQYSGGLAAPQTAVPLSVRSDEWGEFWLDKSPTGVGEWRQQFDSPVSEVACENVSFDGSTEGPASSPSVSTTLLGETPFSEVTFVDPMSFSLDSMLASSLELCGFPGERERRDSVESVTLASASSDSERSCHDREVEWTWNRRCLSNRELAALVLRSVYRSIGQMPEEVDVFASQVAGTSKLEESPRSPGSSVQSVCGILSLRFRGSSRNGCQSPALGRRPRYRVSWATSLAEVHITEVQPGSSTELLELPVASLPPETLRCSVGLKSSHVRAAQSEPESPGCSPRRWSVTREVRTPTPPKPRSLEDETFATRADPVVTTSM